ncbi:UNVERIFIED_CONTAM: hypothetical protein FKN15_039492 [Acipenser sinensis]
MPLGDVGQVYVVDEWCPGCGEFGHTVAICPTQYQGEEWAAKASQDQAPRGRPAAAAKRKSSWDAILQVVMDNCWCPICGEWGHSPLNCPLLPEGCLMHPFPPAEGGCLLVPSPPAEGTGLLVPPLQPEGEEPLPPSPPEGEDPLPPSPPEGEEPLPPSQPEGEEPLPPLPGAEQQELPLPPPPPPEGEEQELPFPS